ncbi:hypothetical protein EWM64_g3081 [Hericium alpestre]|uniref:Uncharacterized protein n=1 Tax=Hericium alpestre TaxID=135208 RepID=A0A4Z0A3W3_9AGAM|nr:hypothetical protein EWM64_g3081 [Hericium alpestre]
MLSTENAHTNLDPQAFWTAFVLPRIATTGGVSPHDKIGAVHARCVLNDELSAMHLAMCALRTRCNALAPISALPAEVLVHIFHLYATMQPPGWNHPRPLGWIEVTHVCCLWRNTAIQFPSLWSDISFTLGRRWTKEILRRTKAAPISVYRDMSGATHSLRLISDHLPHTRELTLVGPSFDIKTFIDILPSPSKILKIMELGPVNLDTPGVRGNNYELPGVIAGCHLLSLRRLVLRTFWVPCDRSEAADVTEVIPFLTAHIRSDSPDLPPWHTLEISAYSDSSCRLHIWRHSDLLEEGGRRFNSIQDADFEIYFYDLGLERSIRPLKPLCQALPLQTIRILTVFTMMNTTPHDWIDIVSGCTNVEAASITGACGMSFCTALSTMVDGKAISMSEDCEREYLFLGELKVLHLSLVDFSSRASEETNGIPSSLLTGWLTDRQRVEDVPALDVILHDCTIPEEWVKYLKMVAIVNWDGYEGEYGSNSEQSEDDSDADEQ